MDSRVQKKRAAREVRTAGNGSALGTNAVETHGKGGGLGTNTVETQGNGSVLRVEAGPSLPPAAAGRRRRRRGCGRFHVPHILAGRDCVRPAVVPACRPGLSTIRGDSGHAVGGQPTTAAWTVAHKKKPTCLMRAAQCSAVCGGSLLAARAGCLSPPPNTLLATESASPCTPFQRSGVQSFAPWLQAGGGSTDRFPRERPVVARRPSHNPR